MTRSMFRSSCCVPFLLLGLSAPLRLSLDAEPASAPPSAARQHRASAPPGIVHRGGATAAGRAVGYVENRGQWDGPFSYAARMGAMTVFVQDRGWTLTLVERKGRHGEATDPRAHHGARCSGSGRGVALRMGFCGASAAEPVAEERLPGIHNYFLGGDPNRWRTGVPVHRALRMNGLYPGIDVRLRSRKGRFEYDLLVAPGADLAGVVVEVEGAGGLRLDSEGGIVIDTALGPVRQALPETWQISAGGHREAVACHYVLEGERRFGFAVTEWDPERALVVDPGLVYSTYLGGFAFGGEEASAIAREATGAVTVCGNTDSTVFPTTPGVFQASSAGSLIEAFVSRFDAVGGALLYSTTIGGTSDDHATGIALDPAGAATICGITSSSDFPTTPGAAQTVNAGGLLDAFVTRLDPAGSVLQYSTYLGGTDLDHALAIALDPGGVATICGRTVSADFPTSPGTFQPSYGGGGSDAFVTRVDPSGASFSYSTYIGGSDSDEAADIALDAGGTATVCGSTASTDFPTTPGALQGGSGAGGFDVFVTRLGPSGFTVPYSTYLGGSNSDEARAIAIDGSGAVTICGDTLSADFPTTSGAFQETPSGALNEAFVTRLDPAGGVLLYSTYLGGSGGEIAWALGLDATGAATVCGTTSSTTDFPITPGAFQPGYGGSIADGFVTRLDPAGGALLYSSYLGGSGTDIARALVVDVNGTATVCGTTGSSDFPTTPGAFQTSNAGCVFDAFVTRVDLRGPGQCNGGTSASLSINGSGAGACGPILASIHAGGSLSLAWSGPPNQPVLLFAGPANPSSANLGCAGSVDIGTPPTYVDLALVFDGTSPGFPNSLFVLGPAGTALQTFTVPGIPSGSFTSVQGVVLQPSGPCSFVLTTAFTLIVN